MAFRKVSLFTLNNQGAFICDIHCIYFDNDGYQRGDVPNHENFGIGASRTMDLKAKIRSLEPGNFVKMKVWVMAGSSNTFPMMFQYDPNGEEVVFTISGTTLNNHLALDN